MLMREVERLRELRLRLDEQRREVDRALRAFEHKATIDGATARGTLTSLARVLGVESEEANDIIDGLEQELKAIATLPLYSVLDPLQRAVRDLCRTLGKEARLAIVGAEISLDRRLLESLKGPLLHLVRNAVDHGIENHGKIILAGETVGEQTEVSVTDDGRGITLEDLPLIFQPGFSTAKNVSQSSGRGVGLDAVRSAVEEFGGSVSVTSEPGKGSSFKIIFPNQFKSPNPS
jgi:chemotaxis protein histidine kinase CheA